MAEAAHAAKDDHGHADDHDRDEIEELEKKLAEARAENRRLKKGHKDEDDEVKNLQKDAKKVKLKLDIKKAEKELKGLTPHKPMFTWKRAGIAGGVLAVILLLFMPPDAQAEALTQISPVLGMALLLLLFLGFSGKLFQKGGKKKEESKGGGHDHH